jgi:preprotein translocase subunit SecA
MFGLFKKSRKARRGEDHVWVTDAARKAGLLREVDRLAGEGASVAVVTLTPTTQDEMVKGLERHVPAACRDLFGQGALRLRLGQAGRVSVALASALPRPEPFAPTTEADASSSVPVEVVVCGRHDRRDADEAVVAFADGLGPRARVTFHLSFDDPLLAQLGGRVKEMLERLGMAEDQPVTHRMVTQAVERAQRGA